MTIGEVVKAGVSSGAAPGVVALAMTTDGDVLYEGAEGVRGLTDGVAMTNDTVFRIFSMTKAVASAAAALLVEDGKLSIDTPVADILPEFANVKVLDGWDGDKPVFRDPTTVCTVRHLATHTSGLVYEFWNADQAKLIEAGAPGILSGTLDSLHSSYSMVFDPGERWDYGVGIDWLSQVIEKVSGQTLDAFVQDRLLTPLGMSSTFFEREPAADRLASIHIFDPDGVLAQMDDIGPPPYPEFYGGGHCLFSTASDYMRFLRMLLNRGELDGNRVMAPKTIDWMFANQIGDIDIPVMKSVTPLSADVDFLPGIAKKHSFAFVTNTEDVPGMRKAGTQSWAGVCNTHMWVDPTSGVAGVILTQVLPFVDERVMSLYTDFERAVYAELAS